MQVICTLALHHPQTAVSHEVTLRYVEQMQHSSLSCFAVGHTSSSMTLYNVISDIDYANFWKNIRGNMLPNHYTI